MAFASQVTCFSQLERFITAKHSYATLKFVNDIDITRINRDNRLLTPGMELKKVGIGPLEKENMSVHFVANVQKDIEET